MTAPSSETGGYAPQPPENSNRQQMEQWVREYNRYFSGVQTGGIDAPVRVTDGDRFGFTHEPDAHFELGATFFERLGLTEAQFRFGLNHEKGHLEQYLSNPEAYRRTFTIAKEKSGGDTNLQKVWDTAFNYWLDGHVNALVMHRDTAFQPGEQYADVPAKFYREKLWPTDDLRDMPRCLQFSVYPLLRLMNPDQEFAVDDEVRKALDQQVMLFGKTHTNMESLFRREIFRHETSFANFMGYIQFGVMPRFEKLLELDKKDKDLTSIPEMGELIDAGLDPTDPNSFKGVDAYIKDKNMSASDRSREQQKKALADKMRDNLSERDIDALWERIERTEPMVDTLTDFWWHLLQVSNDYTDQSFPGFTTGARVNLPALNTNIATVLTNPSQAPIMERDIPVESSEQIQPQNIVTILQLDCSGSMFADEEVIRTAGDVAYAIGASGVRFTEEGKDKRPDFPVKHRMIIVPYGSTSVDDFYDRAIEEDPKAALEQLQTKFAQLSDLGGTNDATAFDKPLAVVDQIPDSANRDKTLIILLQITDGDTTTKAETIEKKRRLEAKGVICKAVQLRTEYFNLFKNRKEEDPREKQPSVETPQEQQAQEPAMTPEEIMEANKKAREEIDDTFRQIWGNDGTILGDYRKLRDTVERLYEEILVH